MKQCACGEALFKGQWTSSSCHCCCRQFENKTKDFYWCTKWKTCEYKKIRITEYRVCSQCHEEMSNFDHLSGDEFTFNKIIDTMKIIKKNVIEIANDEQTLKKYMWGVNFIFYLCWIAKLKECDFGKTEYYKEIITHYHSFYDGTMDKIRDIVDLNEVKLDKTIFVKRENMKNIKNKEQMDIIHQIALNWRNLNDEIKKSDNGQKVDCYFKKICAAKERLLFINRLFKKHFDATLKIDFFVIFENALSDYWALDLLDDLQHFESFHYDDVYECECEIEKFINMEREKEEKSNLGSLSDEHRNILDIALRSHQFINHREIQTKDEDKKEQSTFRPLQWQKWRENNKKYKKNKFVQEMIASEEMENEKDEKEQRMNDLMDELIKKGMAQSKAKKFMNYLSVHQYDTDAIKYDLEQTDMFNTMDQSNLYHALEKNKYFMKIIKKYFKIEGSDNDKNTVFSFGEKSIFLSWQYFKRSKTWFVVPKYATLKDELLKNGICAMDIKSFHRQLLKAHIFASSEKGKTIKAKDYGGDNEDYAVPPFCPISVAHILCALIYCNCTNVQYEFKKYGTRMNKNGQTLEELKQLNAEINHWYSLLFECVMFYGSETRPNDTFYTGLSIPMLFDSFAPIFLAPISTTVDSIIAHKFSKAEGVILKVKQGKGQPAEYFDVEWLSNYPEERERLFFLTSKLRIVDINSFYEAKMFSNEQCIKAMTLFSSLFAGHYLLGLLNEKTQKMLCSLIQCFNDNNNVKSSGKIIKNQISLFMQQTFFNLVHKMDKMIVIKQEYEKLSEELKIEFQPVNLWDPFSPFLMKTNDKNIDFMDEYIWTLDNEQINALKYGQKDVWIYSDLFCFDLSNDEKVKFKVGLRKNSSNKYTSSILKIVNTPKAINGLFSICVDDIGYVHNADSFYDLSSGRSRNIFCFKEKCLEKVSESLTLRVAVEFRTR